MKNSLFKNTKVIIVFSIVFFILILSNHIVNLRILQNSINDLQIQTIKGASSYIETLLKSKISAIESINKIIVNKHIKKEKPYKEIFKNASKVVGFNQIFFSKNVEYNNTSIKMPSWHAKTLKNNKTTVLLPYKDENKLTDIVFICTPSTIDKNTISGVLCGTISLDNIKSKFLDIPLPHDGVIFLTDENNKIIIHEDNLELSDTFIIPEKSHDLSINNKNYSEDFIYSYIKLPYPKWNVILKLNKSKMHKSLNNQLLISIIIYISSLLVYFLLNIFYSRIYQKNEEKLIEANQLIQSFVDYNDKGYLVIDTNHNITYYNKQFLSILNIKEHFIQNSHLSAEFSAFQNAHLSFEFSLFKNTHFLSGFSLFQSLQAWRYDSIFRMLDMGETKLKTWDTTFSYLHNKKTIHIACNISQIIDQNKHYKGAALVLADITQQKELENTEKEHNDLFIQQSKMADLGEMIGAISHQWRQPLNANSIMLSNLLQFKEMGRLEDIIFEENINNMLTNINYLASTIDTFQDFYKVHKNPQQFEIKKTIEEMHLIIEPYCKNTGISIQINSDKDSYPCINFKNEFQQIIEILIINAKDSLLNMTNYSKNTILFNIKETETEYYIEIKDYGIGVHKNIQKDLFKPFVTSKGKKGTGSGLYLSRLIARKKLEGDLTIVSYKDPTIFLLRIKKKIKGKND